MGKNHNRLTQFSKRSNKDENMAIMFPPQLRKKKGSSVHYPSYADKSVSYPAHKWCKHEGNTVVFDHEGRSLYAASGMGLNEYSGKWDLIIDLANNVNPPEPFIRRGSGDRFDTLKSFSYPPGTIKSEVLRLNWPDQGIPACGLEFWTHLWALLPPKTVIACVGGHGRTGTCLASLMIATGIDYYSAVQTVRADHCNEAIESLSQELYLHRIYMDYLTCRLTEAVAENNAAEQKELGLDIVYAQSHVPTAADSYGEKKPEPVKVGSTAIVPVNVNGKPTTLVWDDEEEIETKIINGRMHCKVCVDPACKDLECINPLHMGWVPWDPKDESMEQLMY